MGGAEHASESGRSIDAFFAIKQAEVIRCECQDGHGARSYHPTTLLAAADLRPS